MSDSDGHVKTGGEGPDGDGDAVSVSAHDNDNDDDDDVVVRNAAAASEPQRVQGEGDGSGPTEKNDEDDEDDNNQADDNDDSNASAEARKGEREPPSDVGNDNNDESNNKTTKKRKADEDITIINFDDSDIEGNEVSADDAADKKKRSENEVDEDPKDTSKDEGAATGGFVEDDGSRRQHEQEEEEEEEARTLSAPAASDAGASAGNPGSSCLLLPGGTNAAEPEPKDDGQRDDDDHAEAMATERTTTPQGRDGDGDHMGAEGDKDRAEGEDHVQDDAAPQSYERHDDGVRVGKGPSSAAEGSGQMNRPSATEATTSTNQQDRAATYKSSTTSTSSTSDYEDLRWTTVANDGSPQAMIKLVGLKSLFSKQLPKMPKAYIARLVLDPRHTSLAILSRNPDLQDADDEIIGGICYRAFPSMRFAEIAFCAVNSTHQVKGYGTKLMNLLKSIAATTGIEYFITYADNYAIGYFKKQGFTKSISMPKGRYFGLIKEYDGGTPMECYVHPSVDFTRIDEMIASQRAALIGHVRKRAKSSITVYPPLPSMASSSASSISAAADATGTSDGFIETSVSGAALGSAAAIGQQESVVATVTRGSNPLAARIMSHPGIAEAGWTLPDILAALGVNGGGAGAAAGADGPSAGIGAGSGGGAGPGRFAAARGGGGAKGSLKSELLGAIRLIQEQHFSWPFREPVDTSVVPDYLEVIKEPIDLSTIEKRIRANCYKSRKMLYADLILMVNNCKLYNDDASTYVQCAVALEKMVTTNLFADVLEGAAGTS